MTHLTSLSSAVLLLGAAAAAQSPFVLPPTVDASTPGNASANWPWDLTTSPIRIQYCYDASYFTGYGVAGPIAIDRLRFRAQEGVSNSWAGGVYASVVVTAGAAGVDHAALGTVFDANWAGGTPPPPAYSGSVAMDPGIVTSGAVPGPWFITVEFAQRVVYDPSKGDDLLIEFRNPGLWTGSSTRDCDAVTIPSPLVTRVRNLTDANAPTGVVQGNVGLVCELRFRDATGSFEVMGAGCAGTHGVPVLAALGDAVPQVGAAFTFEIAQAPPAERVHLVIGFEPFAGFDLTPIGMTGCTLRVVGPVTLTTSADGSGVATVPIAVPADPNNAGLQFWSQAIVVDPGANAVGAVLTNGAVASIGV